VLHEYIAIVYNVVDGDTYDIEIDLGFKIRIDRRLRLWGYNTPEVRGVEKVDGIRVTNHVKDILEGQQIRVKTKKWQGKFGRYVAEVFVMIDGMERNLGSYLADKGMAKVVDY